MWTNVYRIGELQVVSWFQLLPSESDPNSLPDKSLKAEQKDTTTFSVISTHVQLQKDGFLSTWTNSFVGPWDPSQGVHNPDEKIKLWLFVPGRHSSIPETAQAVVSRLRVVGTGLWLAPGDSEEVAVALSQALRNSVERALRGLSYVRFGDVFTRCHSFGPSLKSLRRVQLTFEFVFAATEEAVYVHAIVSAKHIRGLCSDDLERLSRHRSSNSISNGLPVVVSPNGMRGRLTGYCPSDLVKQVYVSKLKASNGLAIGVPFQVTPSSGCQLRGQSCYVEVALGCSSTCDKALESNGNGNKVTACPQIEEMHSLPARKGQPKQEFADQFGTLERTFIYPADTVLIPTMHRAFAKSSLKRFCLRSCVGSSVFELWPLWNFSGSSHVENCLAFGSICNDELFDGLGVEFNGMQLQCRYNSSSNSNSSSISSISSTSGESDDGTPVGAGDLEADADSLTSRKSIFSSNDQFESDGHKQASKRLRTGTAGTFGQSGMVEGVAETITSSGAVTNIQVGSHWDWDDDDRGIGMDIQMLLSEFGDFGDFFEDDVLSFGEPPGTAESQAIVFPASDIGDVGGSPYPGGTDNPDQNISPVAFASFEGFNHAYASHTEDTQNRSTDNTNARPSIVGSHSSAPLTSKFDHLIKSEATMTFAPEYAAVETLASEFSTSIFKSPYLPRSKRVESLHSSSATYRYGATPRSPQRAHIAEEKHGISAKVISGAVGHDARSPSQVWKLYSHVQSGTNTVDKKSFNNDTLSNNEVPPLSGMNSLNPTITLPRKSERTLETGHFLLPRRTTVATEVECIMFQAAMCKIRHTLLSLSNRVPFASSKLAGSPIADLVPSDTNNTVIKMSSKYEIKKESIPVRIAGDVDGSIFDGPLNTRVGVWRSVGAPKGAKPSNMCKSESSSSLPHNILNEDGSNPYGQRQPLQELLDAMAFLVQQATSLVDVSLDMDDSDGSYCWLALQEQRRRGFSCGPSMVHAGCGGLLATCHSVDIAGVDLIDPLSADVQVSSVISLLQSDIKVALKSAFGSLVGPLSVIDWCKGRSQLVDSGAAGDGYSSQFSEAKDASSTVTLGGEPISPPQSTGGSSCIREGTRMDEPSQRRPNPEIYNSESEQQKCYSRFRPTVALLPLPAILVGYQDDWLKTSPNCLQLWEKAPLEPYALPKPVTYYAVCPNIDLLTTAAADFFQQLGTVYETCKLGTHSPQMTGGQMEFSTGKSLPSGLILVDCPQQVKTASCTITSISSISDYFLALSKGWIVKDFLGALKKLLKDLKLATNSSLNQKEGSTGPCMVVYIVCPFPEPTAVLQTLVECSAALGSVISPDKERQSLLHSQVAKSLSCTAAADESSASNVILLSGFSIPKVVLQIVTVESLLRVSKPASELMILKEMAFTVYNKARRIPRTASCVEMFQSSAVSGRPQSTLMHVNSPLPGLWKDCLAPRISVPTLTREGDLDAALRPGTWDNSWQTPRTGLNCDPTRSVDLICPDDTKYLFEPFFILAEPGSLEHGTSSAVFGSTVSESSNPKSVVEDGSGIYMQSSLSGGSADTGASSMLDGSEIDSKSASLHCCYGWTEDWRWLVCIWTDSRGELLDCTIFPFGGISSRQDTKVLQSLFVQVLHQACQMLSTTSPDSVRPRDMIITRIGCFFELECQEWQNAIYLVGGNDVKKWPLQLRRSIPDSVPSSTNGSSLQQQEISLIQERNLPSSPSPSLYSPRAKSSYMKGSLGQTNTKKQLLAGQTGLDNTRGLLQLVQSISLIGVSIDHSLHLILPADFSSSGGGSQSGSSSGLPGYLEGFSPVKSLGSMPASYLLIPSPSMRYLPPTPPLQLPTCLTSESPPLAHLLHSKGYAIPQATGYVVSKAVSTMRRDPAEPIKDDWPSVVAVSLVDHYGGNSSSSIQEKMVRGGSTASSVCKQGRSVGPDSITNSNCEIEAHLVLESVAAELHSLSWMTVSPVFLERRTALPFHCDILLRLRRLLHYADKELSRPPEKT